MKALLGLLLAITPIVYAELAFDRYNGTFHNPGTRLFAESWAKSSTRGNMLFWTTREGLEDVTRTFRCEASGACAEVDTQPGVTLTDGDQIQLLRSGKINYYHRSLGRWFEFSRRR